MKEDEIHASWGIEDIDVESQADSTDDEGAISIKVKVKCRSDITQDQLKSFCKVVDECKCRIEMEMYLNERSPVQIEEWVSNWSSDDVSKYIASDSELFLSVLTGLPIGGAIRFVAALAKQSDESKKMALDLLPLVEVLERKKLRPFVCKLGRYARRVSSDDQEPCCVDFSVQSLTAVPEFSDYSKSEISFCLSLAEKLRYIRSSQRRHSQ